MAKQITKEDQDLVGQMTANFMKAFRQTAPMMALNPDKGKHLFDLAICSFVCTAAKFLDDALNAQKSMDGWVPLNIHGKTFDHHLDFYIHLLSQGTVGEYEDERN